MASQKCAKNKYRTHTKFCGLNFHGLKERKVCTCVSVINSVGNFFVVSSHSNGSRALDFSLPHVPCSLTLELALRVLD